MGKCWLVEKLKWEPTSPYSFLMQWLSSHNPPCVPFLSVPKIVFFWMLYSDVFGRTQTPNPKYHLNNFPCQLLLATRLYGVSSTHVNLVIKDLKEKTCRFWGCLLCASLLPRGAHHWIPEQLAWFEQGCRLDGSNLSTLNSWLWLFYPGYMAECLCRKCTLKNSEVMQYNVSNLHSSDLGKIICTILTICI